MTATGILDHSTRIEQLLIELDFRACLMSGEIQSLTNQVISQIQRVKHELDKVKNPPRKFIPLFDQETFYQWNEDHLGKFKETLTNLSLETRRYERLIQNYHVTLLQIKEEIAHVSL